MFKNNSISTKAKKKKKNARVEGERGGKSATKRKSSGEPQTFPEQQSMPEHNGTMLYRIMGERENMIL